MYVSIISGPRSRTHDPVIVSLGVHAFNGVYTFLDKLWQVLNFSSLIVQSLWRPGKWKFWIADEFTASRLAVRVNELDVVW